MSIYTGTMPHHNAGFQNVQNYPEGAFPLPPTVDPQYNDGGVHEDLPTFIEILNDRGWFTAVSHKVHVEPVRKYPYAKGYGQPDTPATATSYIDSLVPLAGDRPFFMMFNLGSPHLPFRSFPNKNGFWSGTGGLTGDGHVTNVDANQVEVPPCYPDVPGVRQDMADYYGAIEVIDSIFGAVADALAANNARTNTLIIFTGDHGIGLHRAKQSCYGLGLHIPLLMSGPGMAGGRTVNHPVSHTDLAPTFLDFAGLLPPPTMTGRSLLPLLAGTTDTFPDRPTMLTGSHHRYDARAVCDGRYYYIRNLRNVVGATLANPAQALNADSYQSTSPYFNRTYNATVAATGTPQRELLRLLVEGELPSEELYDMDTDLWMATNLISQPDLQGVVERLRGEMARWRMTTEDYQTSSAELVRRTERYVPPTGGFTVSAGADQYVTTTNPSVRVNLTGFVSDPGATSRWSKVSGPGAVVFENAAALSTTATISGWGDYVLQLEAGTSSNSASDTLSISVTGPVIGNVLLDPGAESGLGAPWTFSSTGTDAGLGGGWSVTNASPRVGAYCFRWDDNLWVTSMGTLSQSVISDIQGSVPFTATVQVAAEPGSGGIAPSHVVTLRLQWYSDVALTTLIGTSTATLTPATGLSNVLSPIQISDTTPGGTQAVRFSVECTHTNPPDTSKTNFLLDDASLVLSPEE
jgi:N-sulfoglucosamine sulfohydrolase